MEIVLCADLLQELAFTDAWMCALGLNQQVDRIRQNKRDIAMLAKAFDEGRLDEVISKTSDERLRQLMSLAESTE